MINLNKVWRIVLCTALLTTAASAQEKVIDQAAFDAAVKAGGMHREKWAGKTFRMTVSTLTAISNRPEFDHSAKMIFEYGLNGDVRNSSSSTTGGKTTTAESLSVGNSVYSRNGTQGWTRKERQSGAKQSSDRPNDAENEIVSSVTEYKYLGAGDLKGQAVQIYLRTERTKKVAKSTGVTTDSAIARKYWINSEGLILKDELVSENRWIDRTGNTSIVTEWELDPTIVFKEPQITPQP